jgi:uncharacterized membrane protein
MSFFPRIASNRIDMTRTRGKLDAATNAIVLVSLSFMISMAVLTKLNQYYGFQINDYDTGIYTNVIWNILTGDGFYSDILLKNHAGEHFSPIILLFVPFFLISPSPIWLLVAQGLAVGATYVLIFFIALKIFGDANVLFPKALALIFAVWAFFYPPLTSALIFEFHPSTLGVPFLAAAVLSLLLERDRLLWVLVALLLLSKENASLAILGLGIYAWLMLLRPRLAISLVVTAVVSAALIMGLVMPLFQSGGWDHYDRFGPFAEWRAKVSYLYKLVGALAFLPLASWRSLVCAGPLVALNLSVAYRAQFLVYFHYDDLASVFLLVSAIHGANALLSWAYSRTKSQNVIWVYGIMVILAVALVGAQRYSIPSGASLRYSVLPYLRTIWPGDPERQLYREIARYRHLPLNVGVATDGVLGPYLSARERYIDLKRYENFALLRPGDIVLITPVKPIRANECEEVERVLKTAVEFSRLEMTPVLCAYEVTAVRTKPLLHR